MCWKSQGYILPYLPNDSGLSVRNQSDFQQYTVWLKSDRVRRFDYSVVFASASIIRTHWYFLHNIEFFFNIFSSTSYDDQLD